MTDLLISAVENLEVAVDDYAHAVYVSVANPDEADLKPSFFAGLVVKAATEVALAMADADVDGTKLVSIVPEKLRADAAEAEIAALHGGAKLVGTKPVPCRRCAGTGRFITYVENGVPKGPGGPCYRCNGKGVQTLADHHRNYGFDNFAPIHW